MLHIYFNVIFQFLNSFKLVPYTTDAGNSEYVLYTGTKGIYNRPLDVISVGSIMAIKFESDYAGEDTGFKLQLTSESADYTGKFILA